MVLGDSKVGAKSAPHELLDDYHLYIHPVVRRRGTPVSNSSDTSAALDLVETAAFRVRPQDPSRCFTSEPPPSWSPVQSMGLLSSAQKAPLRRFAASLVR